MGRSIDLKSCLTYNEQISPIFTDICKPFFKLGKIKRICYVEYILDDQQRCKQTYFITTHPDSLVSWALDYINEKAWYGFLRAIRETPLNSLSYFLWSSTPDCQILKVYREKFNFEKGLSIYKRDDHKIRAWNIVGDESIFFPTVMHTKALEASHEFVKCFSAQMDGLKKPPHACFEFPWDIDMTLPSLASDASPLNAKKFLKVKENYVALTPREWACLSHISQGKTAKEVGQILSISPRTVETHLNNIKVKTNSPYKGSLIQLFHAQSE